MLVVGKHLIRAVLALFFASCLVFTWQQLAPMDPALIIGDTPPPWRSAVHPAGVAFIRL